MIRTQIYLEESASKTIRSIALETGKKQSEIIRDAVAEYLVKHKSHDPKSRLRHARESGETETIFLQSIAYEMNGKEGGVNNMSSKFLIDTDVLIDYLKGRDEAVHFLESQQVSMLISAITVGKLYAGVRDGKERLLLDNFIEYFQVVPLNRALAVKGGLFRRDFKKSHSVGLADAMIAATAESENATLVTLNQKHFPMISDIVIPYRKN